MKKLLFLILITSFGVNLFAQNNLVWKGYSSFSNIKALSESTDKMYSAGENALFSKDLTSGEIRISNTVDGLSGETITAIYNSTTFNKTIIGYENGLIVVVNNSDKKVYRAIGIIQKQIPSALKKINSFNENNGILYVSCLFGMVQFYLNNNEFGDTYFLGSSITDYQEVIQSTVLNNSVYALTRYNGIKKGDLTNPNLNDFSQWQLFDGGYWNGIATINNQIVASNTNNSFYKFTGNVASPFFNVLQQTVNFRVFDNKLIATNQEKVIVFNDQLIPILQVNASVFTSFIATFTCATFMNNVLYIGTLENGVQTTTLSNSTVFEDITPNGPLRNIVFSIDATTSNLWAVYGGHKSFNPYDFNTQQPGNYYKPNKYGYSKYNENGWKNTPYNPAFPATALCSVTINPNNPSQVFFNSGFSGILKLENEAPTILYNTSNSGLESLSAGPNFDIRIFSSIFDKSGNLWATNSLINNGLKVLRTNNTWQSFSLVGVASRPDFDNYNKILVDKNNTKWLCSSFDGVIGFNENGNIFKSIKTGSDKGNLPNNDSRAIAIDNKNQLWIGTKTGLRIVSSVDAFLSPDQINATNIIIKEGDVGRELFFEQPIIDIAVDGANRKWVGTQDSGVYLVSANGQQTIYQFTAENSPLPSNVILDLEIDPKTGEVYICTEKGMVSFKGVSTKGSENLENVYIYPNPVRPEFTDTVKISGLLNKANVKITDIEGNLVFETTAEGGTVEWDTSAFGKYKVASGVYMVFIAAQDGLETKVKKVMIVR